MKNAGVWLKCVALVLIVLVAVVVLVGIIALAGFGYVYGLEWAKAVKIALMVLAAASALAVSSLALYGFGVLVDNSCQQLEEVRELTLLMKKSTERSGYSAAMIPKSPAETPVVSMHKEEGSKAERLADAKSMLRQHHVG